MAMEYITKYINYIAILDFYLKLEVKQKVGAPNKIYLYRLQKLKYIALVDI